MLYTLSTNSDPAARPRPSTPVAPSAPTNQGLRLLPYPSSGGGGYPGPREGSPGNRGAPARGVDVKPPRPEAREGLPGPLRGPGGVQKGPRTLSRAPGGPGRPREAPGPVPGPPREGGFTSTPRAGAPRYPPGVREGPPGPGSPNLRKSGILAKKPQNRVFWGSPGGLLEPAPPRGGVPSGGGAGGLPLGGSVAGPRCPGLPAVAGAIL